MQEQKTVMLNGVDVKQLVETIDAIKSNPELAKFKFRAANRWVSGGHSRTSIQTFYGAGQEDSSRERAFVVDGDEPPVLLGKNNAPNAVEVVLHSLASCLAVGFAYNAAARGIKIDELDFDLEGDIDLHGFLGLSDRIRPGYENIRLTYHVKSDAPKEKIAELWSHVQKTSPVFDIITKPVPITIQTKR